MTLVRPGGALTRVLQENLHNQSDSTIEALVFVLSNFPQLLSL